MIEQIARSRAGVALAILVAILVTALAASSLAQALLDAKTLEIGARQSEVDTLSRRLSGRARLDARINLGTANDLFLPGSSFSLASNSLQQRVVKLLESNGGVLLTISVDTPNTGADRTSRAAIHATANMSIQALQELLYRLESESPLTFVEELVVERRGDLRGRESLGAETMLFVGLRVAGYFRSGAP